MTVPWPQKWRFRAVVATLSLAFGATGGAACSNATLNADANSGPSRAGAAASDAGTDSGELEPVPNMLAFEPADTLTLKPKEIRELTLRSSPPGSFRVRFALLGSILEDSAPSDAVLDTSEVQTNSDGIAHVTLTAPSTPTTFNLRASVASKVQTRLSVSVSMLGYTTLRVRPSYSGHRQVLKWTATATARTGVSCSEFLGNPPPDGALVGGAAPTDTLEITEVPIGIDVAVTLRAGHYIGGCANLTPLTEGDGNQVLVYASDRPINLAATQLALSFGPSDARPELDKLMKSTAALAEDALTGTATSDVAALLDAMHDATPAATRDAFSAARTQNAWDSALESAFGKGAARRIRDPAQRWLSAGLTAFNTPGTFSGQLRALGNNAQFKLLSVAQLTPASAGFPSTFQATWSADSSDTLLLGSELTWVPSRLVTALAVAPALSEFPGADSVESALAQSVNCTLVASVLLAHGATPGTALYASCDAACAQNSCASALGSAWKRARDASGAATASLGITATGMAQVGDTAEVMSLDGSWLGQLALGMDTAPASGALSATSSTK